MDILVRTDLRLHFPKNIELTLFVIRVYFGYFDVRAVMRFLSWNSMSKDEETLIYSLQFVLPTHLRDNTFFDIISDGPVTSSTFGEVEAYV